MNLLRHRFYKREVTGAIWASLFLNLLGACLLDGGVAGCIILIGTVAFWLGAIRPLSRGSSNFSDKQFMSYGIALTLGISVIVSPLVWRLRDRF